MRRRTGSAGAIRQGAMGFRRQIGIVRRLSTNAGRPVVDVLDPITLDYWRELPVTVIGGGPDSFAYFPPAVDPDNTPPESPTTTLAAQVLVDTPPDGGLPRIADAVAHPATGMTSGPVVSTMLADRTASPNVTDATVRYGGASVLVGDDGSVTVDATGSDTPIVRVQLPATGILRVSRSALAPDRLLLASRSLAYLTALEAANASMAARISALEAALTQLTSQYNASIGGIVQGPPVSYSPPAATAPPVAVTSNLCAATIHVSSASENTP